MKTQLTFQEKLFLYLVIFREKAIVTKKDKPLNFTKNRTNEAIRILTVLNLDMTRAGI
jgi:hypothetical protein